MNTPQQVWSAYRQFVYDKEGMLTAQEEHDRKQAFFAGSEAVFKIMQESFHLHPTQIFRMLRKYRELNRDAAMETIPDDEQEENLNN